MSVLLLQYEGDYVPEHFEGAARDEDHELAQEMGLQPMHATFGGQMLQPPPPPPLHSHGTAKRCGRFVVQLHASRQAHHNNTGKRFRMTVT